MVARSIGHNYSEEFSAFSTQKRTKCPQPAAASALQSTRTQEEKKKSHIPCFWQTSYVLCTYTLKKRCLAQFLQLVSVFFFNWEWENQVEDQWKQIEGGLPGLLNYSCEERKPPSPPLPDSASLKTDFNKAKRKKHLFHIQCTCMRMEAYVRVVHSMKWWRRRLFFFSPQPTSSFILLYTILDLTQQFHFNAAAAFIAWTHSSIYYCIRVLLVVCT